MLDRYPDLPRTVAELHGLKAGGDIESKFSREEDRMVLAFGKHRCRPLDEVARDDPGFLKWSPASNSWRTPGAWWWRPWHHS